MVVGRYGEHVAILRSVLHAMAAGTVAGSEARRHLEDLLVLALIFVDFRNLIANGFPFHLDRQIRDREPGLAALERLLQTLVHELVLLYAIDQASSLLSQSFRETEHVVHVVLFRILQIRVDRQVGAGSATAVTFWVALRMNENELANRFVSPLFNIAQQSFITTFYNLAHRIEPDRLPAVRYDGSEIFFFLLQFFHENPHSSSELQDGGGERTGMRRPLLIVELVDDSKLIVLAVQFVVAWRDRPLEFGRLFLHTARLALGHFRRIDERYGAGRLSDLLFSQFANFECSNLKVGQRLLGQQSDLDLAVALRFVAVHRPVLAAHHANKVEHFGQHHNDMALLLVDHPPEIVLGLLGWPLSGDVGFRL